MGNSATKETRTSTPDRPERSGPYLYIQQDDNQTVHADIPSHLRSTRTRHEGSSIAGSAPSNEQRKEYKAEKDARRAAKERAARLKERERSLKEESVDGGYVVTLGTYTGPEDFSKPVVRQLMLERRLAPFWRGLNDHSDSWTEHQLVAAARGLPIPAPDEIPKEVYSSSPPAQSSTTTKPIPIHGRPGLSQAASSSSYHGSSTSQTQSPSSPLFRGRSRTLASLNLRNNDSQTDLTPQEIRLPHEPLFKGQPVEAHLYKDCTECPICFLYYPPYLNRTRCCDQPICSECFVQIKRPDPHPPEHLDPNSPVPEDVRRLEEQGQLVSEPAACPFCVQTEFGVSYDPPPFRRGLAYNSVPFSKTPAPISSSPYTNGAPAGATRRRGQSLSATAPSVITTDRVRPDWAKKLSDARGLAARRSAAASALHAAAYMMGGNEAGRVGLRRRRYMIDTSASDGVSSEDGVALRNMEMLMAALSAEPGPSRGRRAVAEGTSMSRFSSNSSRTDEIEDLMMREAIRLSLAAEEERKKKEEKEEAKQAKKAEKAKAKEQKKSDKAAKKSSNLYSSSANASSFFTGGASSSLAASAEEGGKGKGKAPAASSAATSTAQDPLMDATPASMLSSSPPTTTDDHDAERSRAIFDEGLRPRGLSNASSSGSSIGSPSSNSSRYHLPGSSQPDSAGAAASPFGSLAAMIGKDSASIGGQPEHAASEMRGLGDSAHVGSPLRQEQDAEQDSKMPGETSAHEVVQETR